MYLPFDPVQQVQHLWSKNQKCAWDSFLLHWTPAGPFGFNPGHQMAPSVTAETCSVQPPLTVPPSNSPLLQELFQEWNSETIHRQDSRAWPSLYMLLRMEVKRRDCVSTLPGCTSQRLLRGPLLNLCLNSQGGGNRSSSSILPCIPVSDRALCRWTWGLCSTEATFLTAPGGFVVDLAQHTLILGWSAWH